MDPVFTPNTDWFSPHIPVWNKWLGHLKNKSGLQFLEIGSFEGRSAIWLLKNILTHPGSRLTCIDCFERAREAWDFEAATKLDIPKDLPVEKNFDFNIQATGLENKVKKSKGTSNRLLRALPFEAFDMIYIDGSHEAHNVLTDAVLSFSLLKTGGIMIFDDYEWVCFKGQPLRHPGIGIDGFLKSFEGKYEILHKAFQVILKKTASTL
ncbi:hypothetical protein A3A67_05150 [Candidatus Peribacteria bacterium RIFCSPLOWO2_01_FULL_51_18]|nr:MAG: hypothetical protein A3C52_04140 [Candidatus Peribacteria bacterium RIFCSPHIGHO2_02_FULL_51_15]OGJ66165.1 MAG: hypothetical protein A3A67_05150 [Candidatus Peribacteria bacterium RIFCSPLOWO2_01_FULL_51_18]OGJ68877.1 MAG: hypothetical protein A3J34_02300 [Candidatus Peribacteria bacterium RIFCSPLOWO2_02_FULL_51_10]